MHDFHVSRSGPELTHLFFVNDSVISCRVDLEESVGIKELLKFYGDVSGECINFDKSELSFNSNARDIFWLEIKGVLCVRDVSKHERYLRLPTMVGRYKKVIF